MNSPQAQALIALVFTTEEVVHGDRERTHVRHPGFIPACPYCRAALEAILVPSSICSTCQGRGWIMKSEHRDFGNGEGAGGAWNAPCPDCAPRSALVPSSSPEWQPIEIAPKDGTWMLGWNEDCGCFVWRDGPGLRLLTGEDPSPTHWMPLPDPPSAAVASSSPLPPQHDTELKKLAMEIRSSYGFVMMRVAVCKDAQDAYDVMKSEWTNHEAAFRRLGELLGVVYP